MTQKRPLSEQRPDELVAMLRKWSGGARTGDEPSVLEIIAEIERRYVQPVDRTDAEARAYELGRRDERRAVEASEASDHREKSRGAWEGWSPADAAKELAPLTDDRRRVLVLLATLRAARTQLSGTLCTLGGVIASTEREGPATDVATLITAARLNVHHRCCGCGLLLEAFSRDPEERWSCPKCWVPGARVALRDGNAEAEGSVVTEGSRHGR